jgi:hypothetical protein
MKKQAIITIFALAAFSPIILSGMLAGACAADSTPIQHEAGPTAKPRVYRPPTANQEYKTEVLKAPVELPGVPTYSGQRVTFERGFRYPNPRSGMRIGLNYLAMEDEGTIVNWYRQALPMYKWKMSPNGSDPSLVAGTLNGNTVSIRVGRSPRADFRSEIVVSFSTPR